MSGEPTHPQGSRDAGRAMRPRIAVVYSLLVALCLVGAYVYKARTTGVFACPGQGYGNDRYLAYCQATGYGDYDHGAFWFGQEPGVQPAATGADVLFLGNSRMQFGFSARPTQEWFAERRSKYFLLGFAYDGNYLFARELLRRLRPSARAYVINVNTFFDSRLTAPAATVMKEPGAERRYLLKRRWQVPHRALCGAVPRLCGARYAFFRSRADGSWEPYVRDSTPTAAADEPVVDSRFVQSYVEAGAGFLADLPVGKDCVILTIVPHAKTGTAAARAIAAALGVPFIAPEVAGLRLFDGSHLDRASAERWSRAFFAEAGPRLSACLGRPA